MHSDLWARLHDATLLVTRVSTTSVDLETSLEFDPGSTRQDLVGLRLLGVRRCVLETRDPADASKSLENLVAGTALTVLTCRVDPSGLAIACDLDDDRRFGMLLLDYAEEELRIPGRLPLMAGAFLALLDND